jgi:hypothetical protein
VEDPNLANNTATAVTLLERSLRFHTVSPCRVVDTRGAAGPVGAPALAAGASRAFLLVGRCGIPSTAWAVSVNVTVTGATGAGNLRVYPGGTPVAPASTLNYAAGQTRANSATVSLGPAGDVSVYCGQATGTTGFILDVNGYFE